MECFIQHNPLSGVPEILFLSIGVWDSSINWLIARKLIDCGCWFSKILKLYRKDRVLSHSVVNNEIKIHRKIITINLRTVYHIIMIATQHNVIKKSRFSKLMNCSCIRCLSSTTLVYKKKQSLVNTRHYIQGCVCFIDGGYLLHKVMWRRVKYF